MMGLNPLLNPASASLKLESKSERLWLPPLRIFVKMESGKKIFGSFFELFTSRGVQLYAPTTIHLLQKFFQNVINKNVISPRARKY